MLRHPTPAGPLVRVSVAVLLLLLFSARLAADDRLPLAEVDADPAIPTLQDVLGHDWAEGISSHAETERYLQALAAAAPDRTRLVRYGESYEGRGLYYLVISSPEHVAQLDRIQQQNLELSDPRRVPRSEAEARFESAPGVVWLGYSVHGNEISCTDAALLTAWHLLADRRESTQEWLRELVVIVDPLQNPDGRDRFVHAFRETRGRFVDPHPRSREHTERWPGGRFNHYLFDMNRDWFLQSQQEVRAKVAAYLDWHPHVYVDAHEMGSNQNYYFAPPSDPINPFLLPRQHEWLFRIGRRQAEYFDEHGFAYTTREIFDAFYPGYGSEWPTLQGGLGILWEQASARGLLVDREDETQLSYADGVLHHYVSGLATVDVCAEHRREMVADFYEARRRSVELGTEGDVRHYFLLPRDPHRTRRLVELLQRNGIEVRRTAEPVEVQGTQILDGQSTNTVVPGGAWHIDVAQPAGRLARALLDRRVDMDEEFIERQRRRNELHLPDEIYDVTAWSLPLAFGVPCLAVGESIDVPPSAPADESEPSTEFAEGIPRVAWLIPPTDASLQALAHLLQTDVRVHVADRPFRVHGRDFAAGTLLVKTAENEGGTRDRVGEAVDKFHIEAVPLETGFVESGAHPGGPYVTWVRPPRILMPVDRPVRYSVGHTWWLFDEWLGYPATRIEARFMGGVDLDDFNVIVLADGGYGSAWDDSVAEKIRAWVRQGGTLVLFAGATTWAMGEDVQLFTGERRRKPADGGDADDRAKGPLPDSVPGAFLQATVFPEHWATFGTAAELPLFFHGNVILEPIPAETGRQLVTWRGREELVASGFAWDASLDLLAETPYLSVQEMGSGRVFAFTDDPNYRAMYPAGQRLFLNVVMFGPGH